MRKPEGRVLRIIRLWANISQEECAMRVPADRKYIMRMEQDGANVSLEEEAAFVQACGGAEKLDELIELLSRASHRVKSVQQLLDIA